jgi:hypothetical protein
MKHLNYLITIIILSISCLALPTWAATQAPMLIITTQAGKELCKVLLDGESNLATCAAVTSGTKVNVRMTAIPSDKKLKASDPHACGFCNHVLYMMAFSISDTAKVCSPLCVPPPRH